MKRNSNGKIAIAAGIFTFLLGCSSEHPTSLEDKKVNGDETVARGTLVSEGGEAGGDEGGGQQDTGSSIGVTVELVEGDADPEKKELQRSETIQRGTLVSRDSVAEATGSDVATTGSEAGKDIALKLELKDDELGMEPDKGE